MNRYSRQLGLLNVPKSKNTTIHILGVGGIGVVTAMILSKMGIGTLIIYDKDTVEVENLNNQFFSTDTIGQNKVDATQCALEEYGDTENIVANHVDLEKTTPKIKDDDIVIMCLDSNNLRKDLYKRMKLNKTNFIIDTRMNGLMFEVNASTNKKHIPVPTDKEVGESACTEKAICYNVFGAGSVVGAFVRNWIQEEFTLYNELPRQIIMDMRNFILINNKL